MKRLITGFVIYCCFSLLAQSQTNEKFVIRWNDGSVVFKTGDTLMCKLRYNHAASCGILQVLENEIPVTVSPLDVASFSFYDERKQRLRRFSSLAIGQLEEKGQFFFVENIYSDHRFSIVNHRTMDVPNGYMNYTRLISKPVPMSKKFILDATTGQLLPLSKENAIRLLENRRNEVMSYIQNNHLKFKKTADYIHLFEYHSSL